METKKQIRSINQERVVISTTEAAATHLCHKNNNNTLDMQHDSAREHSDVKYTQVNPVREEVEVDTADFTSLLPLA